MKVSFVAGFGPIGRDDGKSVPFWSGALGLHFEEKVPGYFDTHQLEGVKVFAIWPLSQAAEATFGTKEWPRERPVPQAWIEFDVASPEAVGEAVAELRQAGHEVLMDARLEPWGQTTSRLMSPEGMLVGVSYTPWLHTT
ncbi:glyoxalase [Corallococcus exiguus]|uniref:VOC family protein n=1 Tax=Corallococcus exiguus TaxID=83462 RepID=UPI001A8E56AA|nr:VOC family protein [Corallococcus exiguus]MBN8466231.1 glyoxalase [Corallococcus exiguus]